MLIDATAKKIARAGGLGIAQPVFRQMIEMQEAVSAPGQALSRK